MQKDQAEELLELLADFVREQDRSQYAKALGAQDVDDNERERIVSRVAELLP